jgi:hypothetical protein
MKLHHLQAVTIAIAAASIPGIAGAGGSVPIDGVPIDSIPIAPAPSGVAARGSMDPPAPTTTTAPTATAPASSWFSYRGHTGTGPGTGTAGPVNHTAYRPPGDRAPAGTGFMPDGRSARRSEGHPRAVIDMGQDPPISFGSLLGATLWYAAVATFPHRGSYGPMDCHRPHAIPYAGETATPGLGCSQTTPDGQ